MGDPRTPHGTSSHGSPIDRPADARGSPISHPQITPCSFAPDKQSRLVRSSCIDVKGHVVPVSWQGRYRTRHPIMYCIRYANTDGSCLIPKDAPIPPNRHAEQPTLNTSMEHPWVTHGPPTTHLIAGHGSSMGHPWSPEGHPWVTCGYPIFL